MTPSVPSDMMKSGVRLRPETVWSAFEPSPPVQITSPVGRTISQAEDVVQASART